MNYMNKTSEIYYEEVYDLFALFISILQMPTHK